VARTPDARQSSAPRLQRWIGESSRVPDSHPVIDIGELNCRESAAVAAVFAGLALATRSTGLVLLPVIIWQLWCKYATDYRRFFSYALLCSLLGTSGLWLFMLYLLGAFDSQLAFATGQAAWVGEEDWIGHNFISALLQKGFVCRFHRDGEVMQEPAMARSMHYRTFAAMLFASVLRSHFALTTTYHKSTDRLRLARLMPFAKPNPSNAPQWVLHSISSLTGCR